MAKSKKMELAEEFERRCKRLFAPGEVGESGWRVIAEIRLGISLSAISRYVSGGRPVPDSIWRHIETLEKMELIKDIVTARAP